MSKYSVLNLDTFSKYNTVAPYIRYCNEDKYHAKNPWELKKRMIGDYEFVFITKGNGQIEIENTCYNVKKNDLILFKPNTFHQGKSVTNPFEFLCIHFDLYVSNIEKPILFDNQYIIESVPKTPVKYLKATIDLPEFMHIEDSNYIYVTLMRIIKEVQMKREGFNVIVKSLFLEFFFNLIRELSAGQSLNKSTIEQPNIIQEITKYIELNYMNKLHLTDLSQHVHLEPTYISKLFKKYTGYSISHYLKLYRLSIAKQMLFETDKKVDEIAYSVGFYDLHHFSKVFKLQEGIAPSQYRSIKRY